MDEATRYERPHNWTSKRATSKRDDAYFRFYAAIEKAIEEYDNPEYLASYTESGVLTSYLVDCYGTWVQNTATRDRMRQQAIDEPFDSDLIEELAE